LRAPFAIPPISFDDEGSASAIDVRAHATESAIG
jgi:hypothetical protein